MVDSINSSRLSVIVTAAGMSRRMGFNKLFKELGGLPILVRTVQLFESSELVREIVVSAPAGLESDYEKLLRDNGISKLSKVVTGGAERQDSIYAAMCALEADDGDMIAVHDAARPLITVQLLEKLCRALEGCDGVIPAVAVKDTIKRVDSSGLVLETLVRSELRAVQTPQIFRFGRLREAYRRAQAEKIMGTDDASLIEYFGGTVRVIEGDYRNIKVTTSEDLILLEKFWLDMGGCRGGS